MSIIQWIHLIIIVGIFCCRSINVLKSVDNWYTEATCSSCTWISRECFYAMLSLGKGPNVECTFTKEIIILL